MIKALVKLRKAAVWDAAKPAGTQKLRLSDEEIRANWAALADALAREHIFPGTMSVDAGIHKVPVDTAAPSGYEGRLAIVNDILQWYSNGAWRTDIEVGTAMAFFQSAVPTGWTQDTSANDKVLRVVSGTGGGSGGSWTLSGVTVDGHALSASEIAHTHNYGTDLTQYTGSVSFVKWMSGSVSSASCAAHTHGLTADGAWRPAYIDVVVGTKD